MKKTAIITGGTRGIGLGIAQGLFAANYRVVLNYYSDPANAQQVTAEFKSNDAICVQADVSEESQRHYLLNEVKKQFGGYDVLVNNAGIINQGRFLELTMDGYDFIMRCNFYCSHILITTVCA